VPLRHAAVARLGSLTALATVPEGRRGASPPTPAVQAEQGFHGGASCRAQRGLVRVQVATPMDDI
jgi:hypothetical protein